MPSTAAVWRSSTPIAAPATAVATARATARPPIRARSPHTLAVVPAVEARWPTISQDPAVRRPSNATVTGIRPSPADAGLLQQAGGRRAGPDPGHGGVAGPSHCRILADRRPPRLDRGHNGQGVG